jgi:branched-subunit amino acid ABC-type transport system permease component
MTQIIANILLTFSIYLLISFSFSIIYSPTRFFHIAHAITLTFSAYLIYFFSKQLMLPLWISALLAIICATAIGMLSELAIYRPLRKNHASPMILMIASLGLYSVLQNVISMIWGDNTKSMGYGNIKVGHHFLGAYITDVQIITIIICLIAFISFIGIINRSQIGRNIRAVASNSELSNIFGIRSNNTILWAFGLGSALAAITGILIAFDSNMTPTMGFHWLLYGVIAMILGGVGSNRGLVFGSLLLAIMQHLFAYFIGSQWMDAIAYVILILFLIWKPLGFSGKRLKKTEI